MRKLLLATAATVAVAIGAAAPASAQVYFDRHGVQVGPLRFGDRDYWRDRDYAYNCRVVRERIVTPSGRVVYETHRACD